MKGRIGGSKWQGTSGFMSYRVCAILYNLSWLSGAQTAERDGGCMSPKVQKSITRAKITPISARRGLASGPGAPPTSSLPRYLSQEELGRFRRAVHAGRSARDIVLFGLMYRFGLRAVEVSRLLVSDVDLARRRIQIVRAKGGDPKEYPIPNDLVVLLRRSIRRRYDRGPYLFTGRQSNNQRGLTVLRVQQLFKFYAREAGLSSSVAS